MKSHGARVMCSVPVASLDKMKDLLKQRAFSQCVSQTSCHVLSRAYHTSGTSTANLTSQGNRLSCYFLEFFGHPSTMAGSSPKELEGHAAADGVLFRKLVADGYNQCADAYLSQHAVDDPDDMRLHAFQELFSELPTGAHILDAGCGAGVPVAKAVVEDPRHMSVTGVDISQRQIELAKKLVPSDRATFLCSDMASMDFEKESFDAICAFFSVFHLPRRDHAAFFVRVASWLRPGGRFVFNLGSGLEDGEGECGFWVAVQRR